MAGAGVYKLKGISCRPQALPALYISCVSSEPGKHSRVKTYQGLPPQPGPRARALARAPQTRPLLPHWLSLTLAAS